MPPAVPAAEPALRRQYAKLCDLPDFSDPVVRERIREIVPGHEPQAELRRKFWEYALLTLFLEDVGALTDDAEILSVGAGHEEVLYWLANHAGRVVATDVYGAGGFGEAEADVRMLTDPGAFAPYPYREERLEASWMDARALVFPDASFDAVFSLSSIEHFGSPRDIMRAASEIGRVLKPGGHAFLVTECFVEWHTLDSPLLQTAIRVATLGRRCASATPRKRTIDVFTRREVEAWILRPTRLELLQPLDTTLAPETWENVIRWRGSGRLEPESGDPWPHILLRPEGSAFFVKAEASAFTSVALPLRKSAA